MWHDPDPDGHKDDPWLPAWLVPWVYPIGMTVGAIILLIYVIVGGLLR